MTPAAEKLVVVTASANVKRLTDFIGQLVITATRPDIPVVAVVQTDRQAVTLQAGTVVRAPEYLGVVPAFALGVETALRAYPDAEIIACLHDDVLLDEFGWDEMLLRHFAAYLSCGLAGFGGAWGLGDPDAGKGDYRPTWLVRRGFMSNMGDAEVHGERTRVAQQVAVLDGFSLVFRRAFLRGFTTYQHTPSQGPEQPSGNVSRRKYGSNIDTLFSVLQSWSVVHHAYDAAMGAFARDLGWETWLLPLACRHLGGQTAVGDSGYAEWARMQRPGRPESEHMVAGPSGDQLFWEEAHKIVWQKLGHLLPFEINRPSNG